MKTKSFYKSTSLWSGTALVTLCLTLISLLFKAHSNAIGETIPLVVLALGSYGLNIRGRLKADTQLTIGDTEENA